MGNHAQVSVYRNSTSVNVYLSSLCYPNRSLCRNWAS